MAFNKDIRLLSTTDDWIPGIALLDTQCHVGNWVSYRLVEELGLASSISTIFDLPNIFDANHAPVLPCGVVNLRWKWSPQGTRVHTNQFYVFPSSNHLDVVFGVDFIKSEGLLQVNEAFILTLVRDKKSDQKVKAAIEQARERNEAEKAALRDKRKQQEQQKRGESQQRQSHQGVPK
ncbi:hypothetical protein F5B22DRAFT_628827 [Xylaria bambusicola]|uniref:uncharacterized protein n=1 Tax=Xylaria bambusicola TaxID=326684 RepID=UPI002007B5C5|nr:uncharacterized protein F5B22DRAFT_628827 [Xylaria bambusicola]KAI0505168.1 hypothetical protein F5B22DRAFT_628827 [Xylaria bambusicola]